MKKIIITFCLFLAVFGGLYMLTGQSAVVKKGAEMYRQAVTPLMQTAFGKTSMYSEPVKMKNGKEGVFRLVMTNDAELQKAIAAAKQQGIKQLDVEGKEFFVDYQLFFLMSWLFLAALLIAAPMTWKGKLISMAGGSLLFFAYTCGRLYIMMLDFLSNQVDIGIYRYEDFWAGMIESIAATQKAGFSIITALVIASVFIYKFTDIQSLIKGYKNLNQPTKQTNKAPAVKTRKPNVPSRKKKPKRYAKTKATV